MKNKLKTNDQKFNSNLLALTYKENQLFLDNCPMTILKGSNAVFAFHSYVNLNNTEVNGTIPAEIIDDNIKFVDLFNEAMKLYNAQSDYITGLRIKFAANGPLTKIILIYQPVLMIKTSILVASTTTKINSYNVFKEGPNFIYSSSSKTFVPITIPEDYTQYIKNYKDNIDIRRNETETYPTDYIQDIDTESVIFSFQEIFSMIDDNPSEKTTLIFNCIFPTHDHVASRRNSLIMSPNIYPTLEKSFASFKNMYSDLAHLCPPNCSSLAYKLL